jgi:hypothetical protein
MILLIFPLTPVRHYHLSARHSMSSISALSNWRPVAPPPVFKAGIAGKAATPGPLPSTVVKLSPEGVAAAQQDRGADANAPVSTAARYKGLGYAMLTQFTAGAPVPVQHAELPASVDNQFSLSVNTRSGVQVQLTLANVDDDTVLQVSANAELGATERKALSDLATGFQDAIDGLAGDDPKVRLAGLTQYDSVHLASVDLHAAVKQATVPASTQTLDFHVDGSHRKATIGGATGSAQIDIDNSKLEGLGSKQQQSKAITSYLKQFDQAATRGHGDPQLIAQFKDAFSDLSRTSVTEEQRSSQLASQNRWTLGAEDQSVLTGLADFSASVTQVPKWSNPSKPREVDNFSYEVSQNTRVDGARREDRSVSQVQQSSLHARFHEPIKKGGQLHLDLTPESQNYEYHQVSDLASSDVELGYKDGRLKLASLRQTASQSEQVQQYVLGKLVSDRTIPQQQSLVRDLIGSLAPYQTSDASGAGNDSTEARAQSRQQSLAALSDSVLLLAAPTDLALRAVTPGFLTPGM